MRGMEAKTRPELRFVTKVHETSDINEAGRYAEPGWLGHHCGGQGEERIPILPGIPGDQSQPYFGVATGNSLSSEFTEINTDHCWAVGQYYLPPKNQ